MDRGALALARAGGPYPATELKQVSAQRREAYFEQRDGGVHVTEAIRKRPRFAELNLLSGRFASDLHLIACRPVLIYFAPEVKAELLKRLGAALAPGGYLFIGGTEALIGNERAGYEPAHGNFYRLAPSGELRSAA